MLTFDINKIEENLKLTHAFYVFDHFQIFKFNLQ